MIFKNLFRAKHQNPDPKVRIAAITELSPDNPEQKSQLHELAFNDEDAGVNIAALKRLNSFPLWLKTADTSHQERVQKKARQVVESALMGQGDLTISTQDRQTFVLECKNISLLEKLLKQSWLIDGERQLVEHVLKVINKPHLTLQVLFSTKDESLQLELARQFDDESTLQKLIKKAGFDAVRQDAQHRLTELLHRKEKPIALEKQVKLVLSQLLALRDKDNYQHIVERKKALVEQYQTLASEFELFTEKQAEALNEKYQDIETKLNKWLEDLEPRWQQSQLKDVNNKLLEESSQRLNQVIAEVAATLENGAQDITLGQVEVFENALQEISESVQTLTEKIPSTEQQQHKQLESMFNRLNSCKTTLESLPEYQLAMENAKGFLEEFSQLSLPDDVSQLDASLVYLKEQKYRWKQLTANYIDSLPEDMATQWQGLKSAWSKASKELQTKIQQEVIRCKSKLRVVDNMIAQGRFKPAMSLFRKISVWYQDLPEHQQAKLSRQYDKTRQQVENLLDWQEYIAQPRKPALLSEAETLVSNPLDVEKQADAVKKLRQQWNSLGKVDNEADQALNQAFEQMLEKAFEPCRVFYAERQEKRQNNLQQRHGIIERVSHLSSQNISDIDLVHGFKALQKEWQNAGEVDYKEMDEVHQAYRKACAPIHKQLDAFYLNNAEIKTALIRQTESLLDMEDVFDAVNKAKDIQEQWKQTGPSSKKLEAKQWKTFRELNDRIFARRKDVQQEHRQETDQKVEQITGLIENMDNLLQGAENKPAVHHALDQQQQVAELIANLPHKLKNKFDKQLSSLKVAQGKMLRQMEQKHKTEQYRVLFEGLNSWKESGLPENLDNIASQWRSCFETQQKQSDESRRELTIKLEILADKPSPDDESALRQKIQLKMMADKLQQGHQEDQQALLKQWIGLGPLNDSDQLLLSRVEGVFVSAPN